MTTPPIIFMLFWTGYVGVDGKTWTSKDDCRVYAIERLSKFKIEDLPQHWQCRQVPNIVPATILEREIP